MNTAAVNSTGLKHIKELFLAGKAALESSESDSLFKQINAELKKTLSDNLFSKEPSVINDWAEIITTAFQGQLAEPLAASFDKEVFYNFGTAILNLSADSLQNSQRSLAHAYLNIIRLPEIERRIYGETRWETLIADLMMKSNFTFASLFDQRVRDYTTKTLFKIISGKSETSYSWGELPEIINRYAVSMDYLSRDKGSDFKVGFLLENSMQMALLDSACLMYGFINVIIPANSVSQHIDFILNQTKTNILFVHDEKQLLKIKTIKTNLPHLEKVVLVNGTSAEDWVISFKQFISLGEHNKIDLNKLKERVSVDSLASIMYTSGTTGEPKGIIFSQMNIVYKRFCRALAIPEIGSHDKFLCYLPLYHTFGRFLEMIGCIFWAAEYVFMENPSVETMIMNMKFVKPSVFISIPKKWIELYERITNSVDIEMDEDDVIRTKIQEITGGNLRWGLSAAGFLPPDIFQFFQKYGVELISGFGMTEATGGVTMTPPGKYIPNSLGGALPGIEIKVADDGELLIKGKYVMLGYFGQSHEETFDEEGWLHTGDIMEADEHGFIEIVDRKKEIYKNNKGETIAPQRIENFFRDFETIQQVFLVGDHRPFNTILIYPNYDDTNYILNTMTEQNRQEYFSSIIVTVNKFLAPFERILDFRLISRQFDLEHGELTPKSTYKRRVIEKNFESIIETMYTKNHTDIIIDGIEVLIPNWFLREKGCLSRDVIALTDGMSIPKLNIKLHISKYDFDKKLFRIGDYIYNIGTDYIDLQPFLTNPIYWLGNNDLFRFTGEGIQQWYRKDKFNTNIAFHSSTGIRFPTEASLAALQKIVAGRELSLYGLHLSVILLQSHIIANAYIAVQYISLILEDESLQIYNLAASICLHPNLSNELIIRRELFKVAYRNSIDVELEDLLEHYLAYNYNLLDESIINLMVEKSKGDQIISCAEKCLYKKIKPLTREDDLEKTAIPFLFDLLSHYGSRHPTSYERIRQIFVRYQLRRDWESLTKLTRKKRDFLRDGFRNWLGPNQNVAVDMETGEEYGWDEVIAFEPDVDIDDKRRILGAITQTPILREALFLFSRGKLIRLDDILPHGIWISHLRSYHDKSVYRVSVQTRLHGAFDIVLNLNKKLELDSLKEEVNWLILAGSRFFVQELIEDFGGYWEDFDMWSGRFVPGDTVAKFLQRETRRKDEISENRVYNLWPFFIWNSAAAYFNFWKLTGYRLELADPSTNNFIIPSHDYLTGTKVVSFSERRKTGDLVSFFDNFYVNFVKTTEDHYPFLKRTNEWNYIFSGVINAEGEEKGTEILKKYMDSLRSTKNYVYKDEILEKLKLFLFSIHEVGFIPKQLYFAIKRFHRWYSINAGASFSAVAAMMYDLYEAYQLNELEKLYPETRTRFFLQTAFADSDASFKKVLKDVIRKQRSGNITKDVSINELSNLQTEFDLSDKENFFLTRLTYPHVKPTDSAEILKTKSEGLGAANLVVQYEDYDGNPYSIRKPVSPKEISRLHQIFLEANLLVSFRAEHQFLVAISERGFIIGGLYYSQTDETTVHMEKVVVSNRYRRKGISEGLMNELSNRLRSENFKYLTTGFFRPEYFYRFGFKIEKKHSGLVKDLSNLEETK